MRFSRKFVNLMISIIFNLFHLKLIFLISNLKLLKLLSIINKYYMFKQSYHLLKIINNE